MVDEWDKVPVYIALTAVKLQLRNKGAKELG